MIGIIILILAILVIVFLIWKYALFYRDPYRKIPAGSNIVSPADGTVVYIKKFSNGKIPSPIKRGKKIDVKEITHIKKKIRNGYIIGIFMNPLSVHVNRAPIEGRISLVKYSPHTNTTMFPLLIKVILHRLTNPGAYPFEMSNERNTILIDGKVNKGNLTVCVIQIADKMVNKVVSWRKVGDRVMKGEKFGMIKMGSQVDVILPLSAGNKQVKIKVKEGEYIHAGNTVIADLF